MSIDGDDELALSGVRERGNIARRSARWNVAHLLEGAESAPGAQSVHRALVLLNLVGVMARDREDGVALGDLVRVSGRPKGSVHRVLTALAQLGFVEQVESTGRYRLGVQAQILGELAGQRPDPLIGASLDSVVRLAEISEDTTFLTLRQGAFSVCVAREEGPGTIRNNALAVGDRHPLGVGAGSLAILAALDDAEVDEVLAQNEEVLERYPRITPDILRQVIKRARTAGYALNEGLVAPGSWAIGVALHDADGRPRAALSVASIEQRLTAQRCEELAASMRREARAINTSLTPPPKRRGGA